MTPRWWGDGPGVQRWSTARLRAQLERERERREWFIIFCTFAGAILAMVILFGLSR